MTPLMLRPFLSRNADKMLSPKQSNPPQTSGTQNLETFLITNSTDAATNNFQDISGKKPKCLQEDQEVFTRSTKVPGIILHRTHPSFIPKHTSPWFRQRCKSIDVEEKSKTHIPTANKTQDRAQKVKRYCSRHKNCSIFMLSLADL